MARLFSRWPGLRPSGGPRGRAVRGGRQPSDPCVPAVAGRAAGPARRLRPEGLTGAAFPARAWPRKASSALVVGQDDGMTAGIQRIVEVTPGAGPVRAPGGHVGVPAGAGPRGAIVKVLQR